MIKLVSKEPVWNEESGVYALNFHRREMIASVKNMILVDEKSGVEALVVVKEDDNDFGFDIGHPFSPMLAIGFAMSSFDFKLASQ